jgi:hypothetical protein
MALVRVAGVDQAAVMLAWFIAVIR